MRKELLASLLLLGCSDVSVEVRQKVDLDYKSQTYGVRTMLWAPDTRSFEDGLKLVKILSADSLQQTQVDSVKQAQYSEIEPLYQQMLEFYRNAQEYE